MSEQSTEKDAPWWRRIFRRRATRRPCPLVSYGECYRVCVPTDTCAARCPTPSASTAGRRCSCGTDATSLNPAASTAGRRCSCGTDATSLNPAEVVVHRTDAPCFVSPRATSQAGEQS